MRLFAVVAVGLLGLFNLGAAQNLSDLPACAESCAASAIGSTGCSITDAHCICTASSFLAGVESCIVTACNATDQEATLQFAEQFCLSGGVTITLPSSLPAASSTPAPVSSSSAPATMSASPTSSYVVVATSSSPPPVSTYTGAAVPMIPPQNWAAGVVGALGLGVAAIL